MIPVDFTTKAGKSVDSVKHMLSSMINQSGGLPLADDVERDVEIVGEDVDEDQIEVPKSEFIDDEEPDVIMKDGPESTSSQVQVTVDQLNIAIPKDKTSPYSNQWIEVDDSIFKDVTFNDYDILAFAIDDEPFQIVEAAYEE